MREDVEVLFDRYLMLSLQMTGLSQEIFKELRLLREEKAKMQEDLNMFMNARNVAYEERDRWIARAEKAEAIVESVKNGKFCAVAGTTYKKVDRDDNLCQGCVATCDRKLCIQLGECDRAIWIEA